MKCKMTLGALVAAVGLFGFPFLDMPKALARPIFIVMDTSSPINKPESFGYKVKAKKIGSDTRFSISLTPKASASFKSGEIFFTRKLKNEPEIIVSTWIRRSTKEKRISFSAPTRFLKDCFFQIDSGFLRKQDSHGMNFSGYRLRLDNIAQSE